LRFTLRFVRDTKENELTLCTFDFEREADTDFIRYGLKCEINVQLIL